MNNPNENDKFNLNEYVSLAIKTESRVNEVNVNPVMLISAIDLFIASSEYLDQIKKKVFYDKPFNGERLSKAFVLAQDSLRKLDRIPLADEDQQFVNEKFNINPRVFHAAIGIATEAGEVLEGLKLNGSAQDNVNLLEECVDINWYQAILMDELDKDWYDVLRNNIEKLQARYPNKFTSEDAINRNLKEERAILEKMLDSKVDPQTR